MPGIQTYDWKIPQRTLIFDLCKAAKLLRMAQKGADMDRKLTDQMERDWMERELRDPAPERLDARVLLAVCALMATFVGLVAVAG
jgi:hypothetical protein